MHQLGRKLTFAAMVGLSMSAVWLAIAQTEQTSDNRPETPKQILEKQTMVQGFEDIIRDQNRKAQAKLKIQEENRRGFKIEVAFTEKFTEEIFATKSTREAWLKVLKAFKLDLPSRPEGWKFANRAWLRWRRTLASRAGSLLRFRLMKMAATAYCPNACCGSSGGRTATGIRAEYGVVAVDPRVIPLGTLLYVDRYGFAIAGDTGSKIKGLRIDLCFPNHKEALRFGRRTVKVLLLR